MYKKSLADSSDQYLNYQFREGLGLPITKNIADSINSIPKLIQASNSFEFKEKQFPFTFAETRRYMSPNFKILGDISIFEYKNKLLANNVKFKSIESALENNKYIQEVLETRSKEISS